MGAVLDIAPLRSLVAVADCGGFQRAATCLHLSQGAVSQHVRRLDAAVGAEAIQLAGVQAAVGAGLGVALMATLGQTPEGLVPRFDLPTSEPLHLFVCARQGLPAQVSARVAEVLRPVLQPAAAAAHATAVA